MDKPSVVFYEHSFDDSIRTSLAKSVLNLGNECRALAEENQRLKHERIHDLNQIGGLQQENAYLKSEVERLKNNCKYLDQKLDEELDK
jgi:seryl-tRNA synthetase